MLSKALSIKKCCYAWQLLDNVYMYKHAQFHKKNFMWFNFTNC